MNNELKDRVFDLPDNIHNRIKSIYSGLADKNTRGIERAKKLITDKKVKYGQLKKIIHDMENMDKVKDNTKYQLAGGDLMLNWAKQHLQGERDLVSNKKDSRKRADEIGGITGERKNSHLKTHKKSDSLLIPTNLLKSNSNKNSISSLTSLKLFEEVEKIKKLITY